MSNSFVTSWTDVHQAPLSMGFSRQEYWSGLPFPSPGDLPDPKIELMSPILVGRLFTAEPHWEVPYIIHIYIYILLIFFSIIDYHQLLNISPCALQVLIFNILFNLLYSTI